MTVVQLAEIAAPADLPPATPGIAPASISFQRYALSLLLAIFVLNFFDRQVINILAEQIKHELHLADWQIGAMTGFAFALLNAILGLPLARWGDRGHRPFILGGCVAVWSLFTALSGTAKTFGMLLVMRLGVGAGEAGCTPLAQSLICDYVPRLKRSSALATYHLGVPLGSLLGMAAGGVLSDAYGWRNAFLIAGLPGILFALLAAFTLREPRNALKTQLAAATAVRSSFGETLKFLAKKRSFWVVNLGASLKAFGSYGAAPFITVFFFRAHAHDLAAMGKGLHLHAAGFLGITLGLLNGVFGALGIYVGGQMADRMSQRDARTYCSIPAWASLVTIPFSVGIVWAPNVPLAFLCLGIASFTGSLWFGPVHTVETSVVRPHMRATASSIQTLMLNLIGLGLGPLTVGLISDYVGKKMGLGPVEGVRWALTISSLIAVPSFLLFWSGRRSIREDLES